MKPSLPVESLLLKEFMSESSISSVLSQLMSKPSRSALRKPVERSLPSKITTLKVVFTVITPLLFPWFNIQSKQRLSQPHWPNLKSIFRKSLLTLPLKAALHRTCSINTASLLRKSKITSKLTTRHRLHRCCYSIRNDI